MSTGVEGWELFEKVKEALLQCKGLFPQSTLGLNSLPSCSERKKLGVNLDSPFFLLYSTYSNPTGIPRICAPKCSPFSPQTVAGIEVKEGRYIKRLGVFCSSLLWYILPSSVLPWPRVQWRQAEARRELVKPLDGRSSTRQLWCRACHLVGSQPGFLTCKRGTLIPPSQDGESHEWLLRAI